MAVVSILFHILHFVILYVIYCQRSTLTILPMALFTFFCRTSGLWTLVDFKQSLSTRQFHTYKIS